MSDDTSARSPLNDAIETIKRLLALCTEHGLKREAYSIVLGEDLPEPPKRRRGAPEKRGKDFSKALAVSLAKRSAGNPNKRGAKAAFALELAEHELKGSGGRRRIPKAEIFKRKRTLENEISGVPLQYQIMSAFCVRRALKGEEIEATEKFVTRLLKGDAEAEATFLNEVPDLANLFIKFSRLTKKNESHEK